jgi:hypothetical protein
VLDDIPDFKLLESQICFVKQRDELRSTDSTPDLYINAGTQTMSTPKKMKQKATQSDNGRESEDQGDLIIKSGKLIGKKLFKGNKTKISKFVTAYYKTVNCIVDLMDSTD